MGQQPFRSGIGMSESEWEQPERLNTSRQSTGGTTRGGETPLLAHPGSASGAPSSSARGQGQGQGQGKNQWDQPTPLRGQGKAGSVTSVDHDEGVTDRSSSSSSSSVSAGTVVSKGTEPEMGGLERAPSNTPSRTAISQRAMQRAGFLVQVITLT